MSTYKENLISLMPYGRNASRYRARRNKKGNSVVKVRINKKTVKKYTFDKDAGVIL